MGSYRLSWCKYYKQYKNCLQCKYGQPDDEGTGFCAAQRLQEGNYISNEEDIVEL